MQKVSMKKRWKVRTIRCSPWLHRFRRRKEEGKEGKQSPFTTISSGTRKRTAFPNLPPRHSLHVDASKRRNGTIASRPPRIRVHGDTLVAFGCYFTPPRFDRKSWISTRVVTRLVRRVRKRVHSKFFQLSGMSRTFFENGGRNERIRNRDSRRDCVLDLEKTQRCQRAIGHGRGSGGRSRVPQTAMARCTIVRKVSTHGWFLER